MKKLVTLSDAKPIYTGLLESEAAAVVKAVQGAVSRYFELARLCREALSKGVDSLECHRAMVRGGLLPQRASEVVRVASLPKEEWRRVADQGGWKKAVLEARFVTGLQRRKKAARAATPGREEPVKAEPVHDCYWYAGGLLECLERDLAAGREIPRVFSSSKFTLVVKKRD